jgi:hypothetical protein
LFWWALAAFAIAIPFLLFGLFRWASADPGIDRQLSSERFRAAQESRWLRRSNGTAEAPTPENNRSQKY